MAEVEEPQFTSLAARIAALNQSQGGKPVNISQPSGKRPPPPRPTKPAERPQIEVRSNTINNPPISTFPTSVKQNNNQPAGVKTQEFLPPPVVDRDLLKKPSPKPSPQLPSRKKPPPLPQRTDSRLSPALPARRSSGQLVIRKASNDSMMSTASSISTFSMGQSEQSSVSSVDFAMNRKLPPTLDMAKLPKLPPSRRELEEKTKLEAKENAQARARMEDNARTLVKSKEPPLTTSRSSPEVQQIGRATPALPPRLPSRVNRAAVPVDDEPPPALLPRRLPPRGAPPMPQRPTSGSTASEPGDMPPPIPHASRPSATQIQALRARQEVQPVIQINRVYEPASTKEINKLLDSARNSCAVVYFTQYTCPPCQPLYPVFDELASHAGNDVVFIKIDIRRFQDDIRKYEIKRTPTFITFLNGNQQDRWQDPEESVLRDNVKSLIQMANVAPPSKPARPSAGVQNDCLICRDFSAPDRVAAQYPRQSNLNISVDYLANVLCSPFPSHTDKARAIFTWLHCNVDYDTAAFFGNNVKHATPEDILRKGLAVCGGYAGLYVAIALKAGMECVMVTGHGKGIGYARKEGDPIPPPNPTGHAWNAVRIDNGEWKLLDSCWGAGHVSGETQQYTRKFNPVQFTASNEELGLQHFPSDERQFFRKDGRALTWSEYIVGPTGCEPPQLFSSVDDYGFSRPSFLPMQKTIPVNAPGVTRFQFSKVCEHWDHLKNGNGLPYCLILKVNGLNGGEEDFVPFDKDEMYWWADITTKHLGRAGQQVVLYTVTSVNGQDARGMTKREYLGKKGKCGMGFSSVATWDLV